MFLILRRWYRQRGTPKDLRQAQTITSNDASTAFQAFPTFFVLNEQASSSHHRVELKVAVQEGSQGMVQRILQVDVHASKFCVLSFPNRNILESFQISHLVETEYPGDLVIRVCFRQSIPGWMTSQQKVKKKEQIWTRVFHTMSSTQRDYLGSLLQGLLGLSKPLNVNRHLLCSVPVLDVGREQVSLFVGTWNMGTKPLPELVPTSSHGMAHPLSAWTNFSEYDLVVLGLQEMDSSVFSQLETHFHKYVKVCRINMGVICLAVYCQKRLFSQIRNVQTMTQAAGFAGVGTNKGFVCCAMTLFDQPLLFINCHLAARDDASRLKERIHQYKLAAKKLNLGKLNGTDPFHQHTTFFFGDMNFRVCTSDKNAWPNCGRTRLEVLNSLIENKSLQLGLEGDQLQIEKSRGTVFHGFSEFPITFAPTYKCLSFSGKGSATHVWEAQLNEFQECLGHVCKDWPASEFSIQQFKLDFPTSSSSSPEGYYMSCNRKNKVTLREYTTHKSQVPSWCDRILCSSPLPGIRVFQEEYQAAENITTSDHSPVRATYSLELPQTSSAIPSASFHTCSIQLLCLEVFQFRHPLTSVAPAPGEESNVEYTAEDDDDEEDGEHAEVDYEQGELKPRARIERSDSSEPEIYASQRVLLSPKSTNNTVAGGKTMTQPPPHFPQLACAMIMPFLKETAVKTRVSSKPVSSLVEQHTWSQQQQEWKVDSPPEFSFSGKDLVNMAVGPFLCTREHLRSQYFVLHLLPKTNSETKESAACCVVSLEEGADGRTVNFEANLSHVGQPSGFVRGKYRVWYDSGGWEEEFVNDPSLHPLNPKKLTRQFVKRRRDTSPPPPVPSSLPFLPQLFRLKEKRMEEEDTICMTLRLPLLLQKELEEEEEENDEEFLLTRANTIQNYNLNAFETMFTPREKKRIKKRRPKLLVETVPTRSKKKHLVSMRRLSVMMWGVQS